MIRFALYARYSSDMQKATSIEDQVRNAKEFAATQGWTLAGLYTDYELSGASMITRPGIRNLMIDAAAGKFDVVLTEALDRLSRDQEDIAGVYKRLQFAKVRIYTQSEGEINELHVGLKGTMNALFLKDLKIKVKRGQRGRVEKGFSGGGNCYGYDVVRRFDERGERVRGERTINSEQAAIVRRIFEQYLQGRSPKAIASRLNAEGVPGPTGTGWSQSTLNGNWQRGTGFLNNELYVGQLVWNRVSYPKNPATGKNVTRINPESEWIRVDVPEMRILDQELWDKAKALQKRIRHAQPEFWQKQRPKHLFSQLLKCGCCGGGVAKISQRHYGCGIARNKGASVCSNLQTIRQADLEHTVLLVLQRNLMDPALVATFCEEYTAHINRLRMERNASIHGYQAELAKLDRQEDRMIQAIKDGYANPKLKADMDAVLERRKELTWLLMSTDEAPVLLHPHMSLRYRQEVTGLVRSLNEPEGRPEAIALIRSLIDRIVLTPNLETGVMSIDVHGDLAGILNIAIDKKKKDSNQEIDLKQIRLLVGLPEPRGGATSGKLVEVNPTSLARRTFNSKQGKLVEPGGIEPPTS